MAGILANLAAHHSGLKFSDITEKFAGSQENPPLLEGFAWCTSPDHTRLYLFGGVNISGQETNNLFSFDLQNGWKLLQSGGETSGCPSSRVGSSMAMVGDGLYVFGGVTSKGGGQGWLNDFHVYNTVEKSWKEVSRSDDPNAYWPVARDKCPMSADSSGKLYIFGGFGPAAQSSSDATSSSNGAMAFSYRKDLSVFDTVTQKWTCLFSSQEDGNRKNAIPKYGVSAHSMTICDELLLIFGGKQETGKRCEDLFAFNIKTSKWEKGFHEVSDGPNGRSFHSMCSLADGHQNGRYSLLIGGRDSDDYELDDIYVFDSKKKAWLEPSVNDDPEQSQPPSGRFGHVTALLRDSNDKMKIVIYGGLAELDSETGVAQSVLNDVIVADRDELVSMLSEFNDDDDDDDDADNNQDETAEEGNTKASPNETNDETTAVPTKKVKLVNEAGSEPTNGANGHSTS